MDGGWDQVFSPLEQRMTDRLREEARETHVVRLTIRDITVNAC
jgi:hypothetical protein